VFFVSFTKFKKKLYTPNNQYFIYFLGFGTCLVSKNTQDVCIGLTSTHIQEDSAKR